MYEVSVSEHFDAAHALRGYQGRCENVHGHRFQVVVRVRAPKLNEIGISYDFTALKERLRGILARFDHHNLNEVPPFDSINPSSENLAATIFGLLQSSLEKGVNLASVQVWESPEASATFVPEG